MLKGNKGEWSEFYAFLKVLERNEIYAADPNLNPIPDKHFNVLSIIREEAQQGRTIYDTSKEKGLVHILNADQAEVGVFDVSKLKEYVQSIFQRMKTAPDTTFEISGIEPLMKELHCQQIKADAGNKADLLIVIHDRISPSAIELGFSVKSMLGMPSTLLNASQGTNFTYKVDVPVKIDEVNSIEGRSKVRDRLSAIGSITFEAVESESFKKNLKKIDTIFPNILSELVRAFYSGKGHTLPELVGSLENNSMLKIHGLSLADYEYKIKNFLVSVALGMTPQTEWDGNTQHGGYIVVKEDGEIVAYHLYNRDEFMEYLYRNTKLETPSTSRHRFGFVYEESGQQKLKLNLQIRFLH